jgi:hypothetical protein
LAAYARADADACEVPEPWRAASELPLDADGRLEEHLLLLPEACSADYGRLQQASMGPRRIAVVAGALADALGLGLAGSAACPAAACVERGIPPELLADSAVRWDAAAGHATLEEWVDAECQQVHFGVVHFHEDTLRLRWLDGAHAQATLKPGGRNNGVALYRNEHWQLAKLGERFEVITLDGGAVVSAGRVEYHGVHIVGDSPAFDRSAFPDRPWETLANKTRHMEAWRAQQVTTAYTETGSQQAPVPRAAWASITSCAAPASRPRRPTRSRPPLLACASARTRGVITTTGTAGITTTTGTTRSARSGSRRRTACTSTSTRARST